MFDVPNAKRVRREELLSRASSSRSPSPPPENTVTDGYQRLGELLNLDSLLIPTNAEQQKETDPTIQQDAQPHEGEDEEQEFEFRLFSAPSGASHQPTDTTAPGPQDASGEKGGGGGGGTQKLRIRLRSPSPGAAGSGEGRIVNPFRGWEYYFTAPGLLSGTKGVDEDVGFQMKRRQFEDVAVSGEDMRAWAKVDWPGCHLPWKVIRFRRDQTKLPCGSADPLNAVTYVLGPPEKTPKSVKKPGKKRRLQLRKRLTAAEDAKKQDAEKRNRKNREKKIKRRQKAREEKAAAAAAAAAAEGKDVPASPVEDQDMLSQDGSD